MKYPKMDWGRMEAVINKLGGMDGVDQFLDGRLVVGTPGTMTALKRSASPRVLAGLLEQVGEPIRLRGVKRFVAREKLVVNVQGELPISSLGENLKTVFLDLVEENVKPMTVKQRMLLQRSVDTPILAALGDKDVKNIVKARIAFAHVFTFLKTADRSRWYVFYVADAKGVVWAVLACWLGGGWGLEAYSVLRALEWDDGSLIVSR